ncbi:carbohydrate ABC transporter permease [Saccharomonospora cyanea]|uniref:Permease component of ABC-type sugar transporter n=1 Tax=Saccharomonospora cyanea NA-134 TaxID=882082 RepID=H5XMT1_9PSEU|nr:sugar ABC transporter permease [Saccharomonospora cyanea]EHR62056.1 permease component of ABC-type sugar transporter [Saccharomonospora cyanea NA-134]
MSTAVATPARTPEVTRPRRQRSRRSRERLAALLFLLPAVVYVGLFFGFPLVNNVAMSLREYSVRSFYTGEAPFVGWDNYLAVVRHPLFGEAVLNTVLFTVFSIAFQFGIGLALALFFNGRFPGSGLLRSLLLLPWLLPLVVSGAVWRWMLDKDHGVINAALRAVGLADEGAPWLTDPGWALPAVIIVNIWIGIPFNLVILHGGLKAVPKSLSEAAELDGAGAWQRFRHVTWPMLRPVTAVVLMLGLVYTIKVFDVIMVVTGGGPADATQTLTTWSYQLSFDGQFVFGQGAAVGNLLVLVATVFGLLYLRSARSTIAEAGR